jgi:hypothetical protein
LSFLHPCVFQDSPASFQLQLFNASSFEHPPPSRHQQERDCSRIAWFLLQHGQANRTLVIPYSLLVPVQLLLAAAFLSSGKQLKDQEAPTE